MKFTGQDWGGTFTVSLVCTMSGRMRILCVPDSGRRDYCISISRWISERRAGRIVPA